MTPESTQTTAAVPAERRQAVWPWLLLPLVALTLFFLLKTAKDSMPPHAVHHAEAPADSAPSEDVESR
jgi:hypothetical protein